MAFGNGPGGTDGAMPISEINITPLTDVMLVLLIIAMVAAPTLVYKGQAVNLPEVKEAQEFKPKENLVEINAAGELFFNREPITHAALATALKAQAEAPDQPVITLLIAADPTIPMAQVLDVWNLATENKVERVVVVGEVTDQTGRSLLVGETPLEETPIEPAPEGP